MKQTAVEWLDKFYMNVGSIENRKECALIAVNNELESIMQLNLLCKFDNSMKVHFESKITELKEVQKEIELI